MRICGQEFTHDILDRIRDAVVVEPQISRRVCQWLDQLVPNQWCALAVGLAIAVAIALIGGGDAQEFYYFQF